MEQTKATSRRNRNRKQLSTKSTNKKHKSAARKRRLFPGGLISTKQLVHEIQHKRGVEVRKAWNKFQHCIGKLAQYRKLQEANTHIPSSTWKTAINELKIALRTAVALGLGNMREIRVHCIKHEVQFNQ